MKYLNPSSLSSMKNLWRGISSLSMKEDGGESLILRKVPAEKSHVSQEKRAV